VSRHALAIAAELPRAKMIAVAAVRRDFMGNS
jgi:hypothetical protein